MKIWLRRGLRGLGALGALSFAIFAYLYLTLPDVRPLATSNPTSTAFMRLRAEEAEAEGRKLRHEHRWIPYARISKNLRSAVLVAEDDSFFEHEGLDLVQLRKAIEEDVAKGKAMRGASTITQQLAKNLYLSPSRDPLRKLRELIITRRLEAALSKTRILELYLNLIEWGDGVWGAEAAARRYFGTSAASLSPSQAAILAGAIINPRLYSPARPNARLLRRQRIILARMGTVTPPAPEPVPVLDMATADEGPTPQPFPMPDDEPPPADEPAAEITPDADPDADTPLHENSTGDEPAAQPAPVPSDTSTERSF